MNLLASSPSSLDNFGPYCVHSSSLEKEQALENIIAVMQSPYFDSYEFSCQKFCTNYLNIRQGSWLGGYDACADKNILVKEIRPIIVSLLQGVWEAPAVKVHHVSLILVPTRPYGAFADRWLTEGRVHISLESGHPFYTTFGNPGLPQYKFSDELQRAQVSADFKRWRREMHDALMSAVPHK